MDKVIPARLRHIDFSALAYSKEWIEKRRLLLNVPITNNVCNTQARSYLLPLSTCLGRACTRTDLLFGFLPHCVLLVQLSAILLLKGKKLHVKFLTIFNLFVLWFIVAFREIPTIVMGHSPVACFVQLLGFPFLGNN